MEKNQAISMFLVVGLIITTLSLIINPYIIDEVSGQPNDSIDGYQELHDDWTVTGYEEYTDEIIALFGDLTIQGGGRLVLNNCTLMMMSMYLQPYDIIVNNKGTLEMYDCYITDTPDDDDTEFLSSYYYLIAREGSTLIIENSTVRQCGFVDLLNPEHLGLSISTNQGHISNSTINNSLIALSFWGDNAGFYVDGLHISQISMMSIFLTNSEGLVLNDVSYSELGENQAIDVDGSSNFRIENFSLEGEERISIVNSQGFSLKNINSDDSERFLRITYSNNFEVKDVKINGTDVWEGRIDISRSSNFIVDNITAEDDINSLSIEESSYGKITNMTGYNVSRILNCRNAENIEIADLRVENGSNPMSVWDSNRITIKDIEMSNVSFAMEIENTDNSVISNLTILGLEDYGPRIRSSSNNVTISNVYIETDEMVLTHGLEVDSSNAYISNLETFNVNNSLSCFYGDIYGENIYTDGLYDGDVGVDFYKTKNAYLSNITLQNRIWEGVRIRDCDQGHIRIDNLYIEDSERGGNIEGSNVTFSNFMVNNADWADLWVKKSWQTGNSSHVTIMNSTNIGYMYIDYSDVVCINATNTTAAGVWTSTLTWKWWVDVFVYDTEGPINGATVEIYNKTSSLEITSITESDGFARNIPVTDSVWTASFAVESMNNHTSKAKGPGWLAENFTEYTVNTNMQVNVFYSKNAPPHPPKNILALSDEESNTVLTWEPSISSDVKGYNVYYATDYNDFKFYVDSGIPNATVYGFCNYTHISGSEDWQKYWYGVRAFDEENESVMYDKTTCGDWVINKTSPQYVDGGDITLEGSLLVYGHIDLYNTTLKIDSPSDGLFGIWINNSGSFTGENITIKRNSYVPYTFKVGPDAVVYINGSYIERPGIDDYSDEESIKGIYSQSRNLTITNTTIDVRYGGLGFYDVTDFQGLLYNISFTTSYFEHAEFLMCIKRSSGVSISNCILEREVLYGIYAESSSDLHISSCYIWAEPYNDQDPVWGIYFVECMNSQIIDNTLIRGEPPIHIFSSVNITIESNNISAHRQFGIYCVSSWYTKIRECFYDVSGDRPDIGIYTSWCRRSVIENMFAEEIDYFLVMENESQSEIVNLTVTEGSTGLRLINSDNIFLNDTYVYYIQQGIDIIGCRDITLFNTTVNLTFVGLYIQSPGPVNLKRCVIKNCIAGEITAKGFEGELGIVNILNSTISPISDISLILNNSAVVSLINTSLNLSKISIEDSTSRVELYHFVSIQVYDIEKNIPFIADISILNFNNDLVYTKIAVFGFADWITIHEKTMFRDEEYLDNPHVIYVFDGSHVGNLMVNVTQSQHIDVYVSNQMPWVSDREIIGYYDNPDPQQDYTYLPTTKYDIILNYTYEDYESDPETGTIIHWYINGVYNSTFDNLMTISYQYTQKGQLWQAIIYPSDKYNGTYPTYPYETNIIHIINTPPQISNVIISPSDPTGGDDLYVDYNVFDLDGDGLDSSKTTHKWYKYNETSGYWEFSTIDSYYLSSQYTSKGEQWRCNVTPHDGDDEGSYALSIVVIIGNSPPSISNPRITSEAGSMIITGSDNLLVQYNFTDPDGDGESGSSYGWYLWVDGTGWTQYGGNSNILSYTYTLRGDLWRCRIVPMDGEDAGEEAWTEAVEIFNTPPVVSNVIILPQSATSSDSLEVTYNFYDYDDDTDNGTSFRWVYEDAFGVGWDSGITGNVTQAERTLKGQTWFCYVTPSDGFNVGNEVGSQGVLIGNSPPDLDYAEIIIDEDVGNRWLTLAYTHEDVDGDSIENVEILWFADSASMPQFDDNQTVPGDYLEKDQIWNATLRAFDGEDWSDWITADSISIPNMAPYINGTVALTPQKALSNQNLTPIFQNLYQDDDGDALLSWEVKWYRDNGHMEDYDDHKELSWELTRKGEIWFCKIRVSDGEDVSDWFSSTTTVIKNSPPSNVTKSPEVTDVTMTETETREFNVSADDMDDDTLSFRWTLDGRIVLLDEEVDSSIYLFKTDYDSEGEYILRLIITDGDDTNEITWTVGVQKMNRLPKITVVEPEGRTAKIKEKESLNFAITKTDSDGDSMDVRWYLDGTPVWEGSDKYTYNPDYYSSGKHNITAEVYETATGANSTYTWEVEVEDIAEATETFFGLNWDQWGIILEVLVIAATGLLAFVGYSRIRKKKGALKTYMAEIDELSSSEEMDLDEYTQKLNELEAKINEEFKIGKIEDLHYLMLQEIIVSKRGEFRKAEVSRKFERLPEGIVKDLDEMLKDGKISRKEYESFVGTISKSETLTPYQKEELSKTIEKWEVEDKDSIQEESLEDEIEPKESPEAENGSESEEKIDDGNKGQDSTSEESSDEKGESEE
ncbi:MAG: hypothetical protein JSV56_11180 [Methanomassiliicoccales archaeon]|nr:MAG: hypothetical protein JSV56_11180 [Methanomassiliicoccales archaeon]